MKTVLVTGNAGFIGFHLSLKLIKMGYKVVGLDNYNDYYDVTLKRARAEILKGQGVTILETDLCDVNALKDLFSSHTFSYVVHLAAQAGVRYSLTNPQAYIHSNITGFINLLEICKEIKGLPFIYASSSSVYGCNTKVPFSIEDSTDHPANFYGATKKANEVTAFAYHHLYKIPVTGLRFFTVYGPWGRPDMAYFSFTKALFEGHELPVFNEGAMMRDFTFIDDIVDGTIAAMEHAAPCEVFNLGNNSPTKLLYFIELIEKASGKKANLKFLPMQQGDMVSTYADIDHSIKKIGFKPKVPLEIGIPLFVEWYRSFYKV